MHALVRIALGKPYTFVVLAILILIAGPLAALRTPTDIFPEIRIPVIAVIWQFTGLSPDQMAGRITSPFQRVLTTTVNDIRHIEAQSLNGFGIVKIFFQPNVNITNANAPSDFGVASDPAPVAAGDHPAADPQLQRLDGADHSTGVVRQESERTTTGRYRPEHRCD